ncbi:hypothetical protein, partial [Thiolapillus sp.]|uniref:hypothetical protein n=3 Tax=Thiolapillus sp. TaxID=2017437 RepID=UPI003AF7A444
SLLLRTWLPYDWTPRSEAYFASPLALCARRVSSAASRLLGSTSLRFALHGWQRRWRSVFGPAGTKSFMPWSMSSNGGWNTGICPISRQSV